MLEGSDPKDALRGFAEVVRMEPEKGEWCARELRCCYGQSKSLIHGLKLAKVHSSLQLPSSIIKVRLGSHQSRAGCKGSIELTVLLARHRGFKALKQIVKLHYKLGNHDEMLQSYRCACAAKVCCRLLCSAGRQTTPHRAVLLWAPRCFVSRQVSHVNQAGQPGACAEQAPASVCSASMQSNEQMPVIQPA